MVTVASHVTPASFWLVKRVVLSKYFRLRAPQSFNPALVTVSVFSIGREMRTVGGRLPNEMICSWRHVIKSTPVNDKRVKNGSLSSSVVRKNELFTYAFAHHRHAPKHRHLRKLIQISNALACNNFGRSWGKFGRFHSRYVSIKHCLQVYRVSTNLCYFSIFFYIGWLFNKSLSIYASSASKQQMWQLS